VLLLAVAHVIVDRDLLRKLAVQTEQFRKEGRPVTCADLKLPEYTAVDNAYTVYEQAMDMLKKTTDEASWSRYRPLISRFMGDNPCTAKLDELPLSAEETADLGGYLQKIQPALDLLQTSRNCSKCVMPDVLAQLDGGSGDAGKIETHTSSISRIYELIRHAAARGLWESRQGNLDAAFDWFALGLNIADNGKGYPGLVGGALRVTYIHTALGAVQLALYDGEVPAVLPAAFAEELQKCMDRNSYAQPYEYERLFEYDAAIRKGIQAWGVLRPLYSLNQFKMNQCYIQLDDALKEPDFGRQQATLDALENWLDNASILYVLPKMAFPITLRSVQQIRHALATSALCETALTLKQFKQKNGAYPESLSELAQPLPTDPFSGHDFNYKRDGDGFVLSSVFMLPAYQGKKSPETNLAWCAVR
jgi:hypothetical protein